MSALPWFKFYPGDFMTETATLTMEQLGGYVMMLNTQWLHGCVPEDEAELATMARVTLGRWRKRIAPKVMRFFEQLPGGGLVQRKLREMRDETLALSDKRADAGRRGAEERWRKSCAAPPADVPAQMAEPPGTEAGPMADAAVRAWQDDGKCHPTRARAKAQTSDSRYPEGLRPSEPAEAVSVRAPPSEVMDEAAQAAPGRGPRPSGGSSQPMAIAIPHLGATSASDVRASLFSNGLADVRALTGLADGGARALVGALLRDARDDAARVLDAVARAVDLRPADPCAFLRGCLRERRTEGSAQFKNGFLALRQDYDTPTFLGDVPPVFGDEADGPAPETVEAAPALSGARFG